MKYSFKISATALLIFSLATLKAQKTAIYADPDGLYKTGVDLFDKKQYVSAQKSFTEYAAVSKSSVLKGDAAYYTAACGIELFNKDSEWLMREFIRLYPASTRINNAYNYLGTSSFRKKKYKETLESLDKVDLYKLTKPELAELYFKRGYSYLQMGVDDKAKTDFFEIKDVDNKYAAPANYYFSHISYKEKNYETALQGFNRLAKDETFGRVVPYYITQIYFIQNKFDMVVQEAPKLMQDSINVQKEAEINRMIGESFFNLKDYAKALKYLQSSSLNAQGSYVLGYCCYKTKDYAKAITHFEKAAEGQDSLAQSALYHLADCYITTGEKNKAKNAFYSAYKLGFDKKIMEDALFSFAKLSYELDFNPYNESVRSFTKYITEYPNSPRKEECYNYLVTVYSTTKNYQQAINSIESLEKIDPILKVTYQKLLYFRGIEYFNNGDLVNAEKLFRKSLALNTDMSLNGLNQYWLSEISYQRRDYTTAIEGWKKFQLTQGASMLPEYDLSNYALGYAYFKRKEADDYGNANISFRKFLLTKNKYDEKKMVDATIRTADSYFMNRDFVQASDYYRKAINANDIDVDYSLYQKALCDGLNRNYKDKIDALKTLESKFPKSNYLSAALNQIADTYFNNLKEEDNAITYYEKILNTFPNSSFVNNCYGQMGNIYFARKQDDKAFEYYDKFVKSDRQSDAAKEILKSIKKIFETRGDVEGMKNYFEAIGNPLSENEIEKSSYTTAYTAYYDNKNCDEAIPKWEQYISRFPNGRYITEAYFCLGECAYSKSDFDKALNAYKYVTSKQRSIYSEASLARASYILFKDKKYEEALPLYQTLEDIAETPTNKSAARFGSMRAAFYLKNYQLALDQCTKVQNTEKLSPQQTSEAAYIKARSLYETKRLDDALAEFKALTKSSKNATGAEAYYYIMKIYFEKQDYKEVEKTINKLVSYPYSNDDWNNKGMLLLANAYLAKGDRVDAKIILNTVLENKPAQEYADLAQKKLDEIHAAEEVEKALQEKIVPATPENGDLKIQFEENKREENLFNQTDSPVAPASTLTPQE